MIIAAYPTLAVTVIGYSEFFRKDNIQKYIWKKLDDFQIIEEHISKWTRDNVKHPKWTQKFWNNNMPVQNVIENYRAVLKKTETYLP